MPARFFILWIVLSDNPQDRYSQKPLCERIARKYKTELAIFRIQKNYKTPQRLKPSLGRYIFACDNAFRQYNYLLIIFLLDFMCKWLSKNSIVVSPTFPKLVKHTTVGDVIKKKEIPNPLHQHGQALYLRCFLCFAQYNPR